MQIVVNEQFVKSRARIGNIAHLISMGLLIVGFILSVVYPNYGVEFLFGAYMAMILALLVLSYSRNFTRRWGTRFRQDVQLVPGLRGLDNRHTMFNYPGPELPDHLVVGPTGLYILVPRANSGTIKFDGRRWSRGSLGGGFFRSLSEGALGNPLQDVNKALTQIAGFIKKNGSPELVEGLEARPIIVFTHPDARLEIRNSPVPAMLVRELRSVFRKAKETLEPAKMEELKRILGLEEKP